VYIRGDAQLKTGSFQSRYAIDVVAPAGKPSAVVDGVARALAIRY